MRLLMTLQAVEWLLLSRNPFFLDEVIGRFEAGERYQRATLIQNAFDELEEIIVLLLETRS